MTTGSTSNFLNNDNANDLNVVESNTEPTGNNDVLNSVNTNDLIVENNGSNTNNGDMNPRSINDVIDENNNSAVINWDSVEEDLQDLLYGSEPEALIESNDSANNVTNVARNENNERQNDETTTDEHIRELPEQLCDHLAFNVLIEQILCKQCKCLVRKESAISHINRLHGCKLGPELTELLPPTCALPAVYQTPTMELVQPIAGVEIFQGYRCVSCPYYCKSLKTKMLHKSKTRHHMEVAAVQKLFKSPPHIYFGVVSNIPPEAVRSVTSNDYQNLFLLRKEFRCGSSKRQSFYTFVA